MRRRALISMDNLLLPLPPLAGGGLGWGQVASLDVRLLHTQSHCVQLSPPAKSRGRHEALSMKFCARLVLLVPHPQPSTAGGGRKKHA